MTFPSNNLGTALSIAVRMQKAMKPSSWSSDYGLLCLKLKIIAVFAIFAPQWGLLWQQPMVSGNETLHAPKLWVLNTMSSLLATSSFRLAIVYAVTCLIAMAGLIIISIIRSNAIRGALVFALAICCAFEYSMLDLTHEFSEREKIKMFWEERDLARAMVGFYAAYIYPDVLYSAVLSLIFFLPLPERFCLSKRWALVPLLGVGLATAEIVYTRGIIEAFPLPTGLSANLLSAFLPVGGGWSWIERSGYEFMSGLKAERDFLFPAPVGKTIDHIIMIMDESVRGDYLSVNNYTVDDTPRLKTDTSLINFGVAVSGANCSVFSRVMFRFGMREGDVENWQQAINKPSIWDYAKHGGYHAIYIDTWRSPFNYGNGFTPAESQKIDKKISVLDDPSYLRDEKVVNVIKQTLEAGANEKIFLYVDKFGVHSPYYDKYPREKTIFTPEGSALIDISRAHYANAIAWSVDNFFARLKNVLSMDRTLLIYTSDHGQTLSDSLPLSHCSNGVDQKTVSGEGYVPLFAKTNDEGFGKLLRHTASEGNNHFSHFEIFPTLLLAMGYEYKWVKERYGDSLLDIPASGKKRAFYAGSPTRTRLISTD
ncbi:sulfatase-like hydrolase/transferase [Methylocystis sp. H62]|uniref:sulfatase-like hydrolase/transferase n=1 Tax=Methylocystis sp. H62 TaxID=2785789 RepID=UPI0018C27526|nr:sulfatase-like hydrolase/transferase [Methylocystis sp. H62]MBG0792066.1 sulfatase-like hydrolase/transferase [Methylocystis sp. H62]